MDEDAPLDELKSRLAEADALISTLRESEARLRLLTESWAQASWETDAGGVVVADSPSWRAYTGQTLHEWLGYGWLDAIHPDDRAYAERQWREAVAARKVVNAEFRLRAPDGGWRWTNVRAAAVLDEAGRIEKWVGINIDIDARKRAEAALRESEERFHVLFAASPAPFLILRPDAPRFTITEVNEAYLAATMRSREEVIGRGVFEAFPDNPAATGDASVSTLRASFEKVLATRQPDTLPGLKYDIARPDGTFEERWWSPVNSPALDAHGEVVAIIHNANDVTKALRTEAALRANEEKYRSLFESVNEGFAIMETVRDDAGRLIDLIYREVNPVFERMTGLRAPPGTRVREIVPNIEEEWLTYYDHASASGEPSVREEFNGDTGRWFRTNTSRIGGPGSPLLAVAFDDVSERKRAETALRESEEKYRTLFEAMAEGFLLCDVIFDETGRAIDIFYLVSNSAAVRLVGVDLTGKRLREVSTEYEDYWYEIWGRVAVTGKSERAQRYAAPEGIWYDFHVFKLEPDNPESRRVAVLFQDITERKRGEVALRESEERLTAAFASVPVGIAVFGTDGKALLSNDEFRHFLPTGIVPSRDPKRVRHWQAWDADGRLIPPQDYPNARALRGEHVNPGLEMLYTDDDGRAFWTNVATAPVTDAAGQVTGCVSVINDITERKKAEAALRKSEEKYRTLFETMGQGYAELEIIRGPDGRATDVRYLELNPQYERLTGIPVAEARGRTVLEMIPDLDDGWIQEYDRIVRSGCPGQVENEVTSSGRWYEAKIYPRGDDRLSVLSEEITVRKKAEAALRESEARFQQFAAASSDALWIRDANTFAFEYVSAAVANIFGVEPEQMLADDKLLNSIILPEERDAISRRIERIAKGERLSQEYRIRRSSDGAFRWIRSTGFPLVDEHGKIGRIGAIAVDITEARQLAEHQGVLLAELQHRVRNIMGMIRSMNNRTASTASAIDDFRSLMEGRLLALARVQALLTREANMGVPLRIIVESEIAAQAQHGDQFELSGPDITLSPKVVEVISLALHELATNALKYGAFSVPDGRLIVNWSSIEKRGTSWLLLDWIEKGAPPRPYSNRRGFGSELIEGRIPYELGGSGKIIFAPEGVHCHLEFPLRDGPSVLETDAPQPATIFGGALDMIGAPDLTGLKVLVVEDDYYQAADTAAALRGAGAEVLGPCANEEKARDLLNSEMPTHAVIDLNLGGGGPNFEVARLLKSLGIPFVFLTGYDAQVVPQELTDVVRLQKPVEFRQIIEEVGRL